MSHELHGEFGQKPMNLHVMQTELAALKSEREELREALAQCVRRLDTLNTGGPDEPDPTVVKARAVLAKGKAQ